MNQLHHMALAVFPPREIHDFYMAILGMKFMRQFTLSAELTQQIFGIPDEIEVQVVGNENITLELFIWPQVVPGSFEHICLTVPHRENLIKKAALAGYPVTRILRDQGDLLFVRDKSGNLYEIKEG